MPLHRAEHPTDAGDATEQTHEARATVWIDHALPSGDVLRDRVDVLGRSGSVTLVETCLPGHTVCPNRLNRYVPDLTRTELRTGADA